MFLWIELTPYKRTEIREADHGQRHPTSIADLEDLLFEKARAYGVLVSKGSWFRHDRGSTTNVHVRVTFAAAPEGDLNLAISRFGDAVRTLLE